MGSKKSASSVQVGESEEAVRAAFKGGFEAEKVARVDDKRGLDWTGCQVSNPKQYLVQYAVYGASKSSI